MKFCKLLCPDAYWTASKSNKAKEKNRGDEAVAKCLDLTLEIRESMPPLPVPWYVSPEIEKVVDRGRELIGIRASVLRLLVHSGTHIDAPAHFFEDGQKISEIPLDTFVGEALVVQLNKREREPITSDDLENVLGDTVKKGE